MIIILGSTTDPTNGKNTLQKPFHVDGYGGNLHSTNSNGLPMNIFSTISGSKNIFIKKYMRLFLIVGINLGLDLSHIILVHIFSIQIK